MLMNLLTGTMKETKKTDDDKSDGNRNELMTTMMKTQRMMRMMKMSGMEDDEDAQDANEDENEDGDYDEQAKTSQCSNRLSPSVVSKRNLIKKTNGNPNLHKDVRDNATYA